MKRLFASVVVPLAVAGARAEWNVVAPAGEVVLTFTLSAVGENGNEFEP